MSDREDFELEALQRQLDDAFETTRPRRGFEDELWLRMQTRRPLWTRLQDGLAGLFQAAREAPAVPAAAIAALLVVAIGVGILRFGASGVTPSTTTNLSQGAGNAAQGPVQSQYRPQIAFGPLPGPAAPRSAVQQTPLGQVSFTWTGQLNLGITNAPVFRYFEPSAATPDQLATSLGAVPQPPAASDLGDYASPALQLQVHGSIELPPLEPFFYLVPATNSRPSASPGGPVDTANAYLASLSLTPAWPYTIATETSGDATRVKYLRQFDVPDSGLAPIVDSTGQAYGLEVDIQGGRPVLLDGPLPIGLDSANYPIITADQAIRAALATGTPPVATGTVTSPRVVQLTKAELVYVLVVAGDHSFYEPAILFSGTLSANGHTYTQHLLIPAVDPSQRTS